MTKNETTPERGGARANAGRPPLAEGEAMVVKSFRLTAAQREFVEQMGGSAWLRKLIDQAKKVAGK